MKISSNLVFRCILASILAIFALSSLSGCNRFSHFAKNKADNAAYKIIQQKQEAALGKSSDFTIEELQDEATQRLLNCATSTTLVDSITYSTSTCTLPLADALAVSLANSRLYQLRKEQLFEQALGLTGVRYDFSANFTAAASGDLTRVESGHHTLAGPKVEKFGTYDYTIGVAKRVALTGARISTAFTHSLTRFFNVHTDPRGANGLSFNIIQPLLNGAGSLVAGEPLRQAERNLIYAVRDFRRFQQDFIIGIASDYYRLLQDLDRLANEYHNYQSAVVNRERVEMLAKAGRAPEFEADQARQRELSAKNQWNNAQSDYLRLLDRFKFSLGLMLTLDFGPDPTELALVSERGLVMPEMTLEEAVEIALNSRLDLKTVEDQVADATRKMKIAFRNFLPTLDASYNYSTTLPRNDDRVDIDFRNNTQNFGLDLILPLDWTPRRNFFRLALIDQARALRNLEAKQDEIVLEVRDAWRQLDRARTNFEIQLQSLHLAERRVESVTMLLEAGRAITRDLLEAQDALVAARNALTNSLVDHTIQRMRFWNAIERFEIDPKGMWYEKEMPATVENNER